MPLPPNVEALRAQAARSQARRNAVGAAAIFAFVASVFAYSILAVGSEDNVITDRDVAEFRSQRQRRERAQERTPR